MGTRTVIRFVKKNYTSKKQLYIHWDGHIHFVGKKLFEMMQEYTGFFHSNIIGLTDTAETISEVAQSYGVNYQKKKLERSALGYVINHTADIYLVDSSGMLVMRYPHDVEPEVLVTKIRNLLVH